MLWSFTTPRPNPYTEDQDIPFRLGRHQLWLVLRGRPTSGDVTGGKSHHYAIVISSPQEGAVILDVIVTDISTGDRCGTLDPSNTRRWYSGD